MKRWVAGVVFLIVSAVGLPQEPAQPSLAQILEPFELRPGLLDLHLDRQAGRLLAVLPPAAADGEVARFLHVAALARGLGSNPVGLDRGRLGETRVLVLRRVGNRILAEQVPTGFRSGTDDVAQRRAVEESFASSVLWAGTVEAADDEGRLLVDLTSFVVRDAHGIASQLAETGQGEFRLDEPRSAIDLERCLAFPDNLELEAWLTFACEPTQPPAPEVRATSPDPGSVTLIQRLSLLRLPDDGYQPLVADPRAGCVSIGYRDFAAPLGTPLESALAVRHRLRRADPAAVRSPVAEPIVYHVDRAAPEPVRSALLEGAGWWRQAFEAAGAHQAFRVELLPEGVHPLDARYNVIQWVHRATRGWSYGGGVVDPRTGERIKGNVRLGSLRVRQDVLLFEGLAGAGPTGTGDADDGIELALARIRQLAAHEVGHALGLDHNFAGSACGRASVMDYPGPWIDVSPDGALDFSRAYAVGIGAWDELAIRWLYGEWPAGEDAHARRDALLEEARAAGLLYLSDADARSPGTAHPLGGLWDNGSDPATELERTLRVRAVGLARFGEGNLALGAPLSALEEVLAPLYLHHRYQLEVAVKALGGMEYEHGLVGGGGRVRPVDGAVQRRALKLALATLEPSFLDLPEEVLALLVPPAHGPGGGSERFGSTSGPAFDALGAAATAADLTVALLLHPARCSRLVDFHRRHPELPGLGEVLDKLLKSAFAEEPGLPPRERALARTVQAVVVQRLIGLAADPGVPPAVRARAEEALRAARSLADAPARDGAERAHRRELASRIARWLERPAEPVGPTPAAAEAPPGSPIGGSPAGAGCSRG